MFERLETKASLTVSDTGEISGVAWVFSRPDQVGDLIERKAFANIKTPLTMLFAHDQAQPIGVWTSVEVTGDTLSVKGKLLVDSVDKAREVYALIKAGALRGLSIGFRTLKSSPRKGGRSISSLDLKEISAVAVPAHPDAQIQTIKSATIKGKTMENEDTIIEEKTVDPAAIEEKFASLETKMNDLGNIGSRLDKIEARISRPGAPAIIATKAADPAELERKALVDYVRFGTVDTKALSVAVGAGGGYLVPPVLANEIVRNIVLASPIRSVARVTAVSVPSIVLPKRTATPSAAWVGETAPRTESDPVYAQQTLSNFELGVYVDVSNQLLEDSQFPLEQEIARDLGLEFGRAEGAAFVNGDGVGKPTGLLHAPALGSIVNAAGPTLAPDDIVGLYHELPTLYANSGVFLANRRTIGVIRAMRSTTGEFLWAPGSSEAGLVPGNPGTLLGRPIIETPDMPDVAPSTISLIFADMASAYRVIDRVSIDLLRDPFTQRTTGQTRFHARKRVGGDIVLPEAIRFLKTTA